VVVTLIPIKSLGDQWERVERPLELTRTSTIQPVWIMIDRLFVRNYDKWHSVFFNYFLTLSDWFIHLSDPAPWPSASYSCFGLLSRPVQGLTLM
jgi:hypothetical protein